MILNVWRALKSVISISPATERRYDSIAGGAEGANLATMTVGTDADSIVRAHLPGGVDRIGTAGSIPRTQGAGQGCRGFRARASVSPDPLNMHQDSTRCRVTWRSADTPANLNAFKGLTKVGGAEAEAGGR